MLPTRNPEVLAYKGSSSDSTSSDVMRETVVLAEQVCAVEGVLAILVGRGRAGVADMLCTCT